MIRWIERAVRGRARGNRPRTLRNHSRLTLNPLEDRVTPAPLPPTITDPAATVRVDQDAYTILGHLAAPARDGTSVKVYADSNHNGVFNPGIDALTA